jgi:Malectin domain
MLPLVSLTEVRSRWLAVRRFHTTGSRLFDVQAEGQQALRDIDIYALAGGTFTQNFLQSKLRME